MGSRRYFLCTSCGRAGGAGEGKGEYSVTSGKSLRQENDPRLQFPRESVVKGSVALFEHDRRVISCLFSIKFSIHD